MSKPENVQKVIEKLSIKEGKIKFEGDETNYTISKNVLEKVDFKKFFIGKGSTVEVGINEGYINFLKKVKSAKKEQVKEESTPAPTSTTSGNQKTLTIHAIAANKAVIKFKDYTDDAWIKVSPELQQQDFQAQGIVAKAQVYVEIVKDEDGKDVIKSITVAKTEAVKEEGQPVKKEWKPYSASDNEARQTSIESQAAINAACQVVARIIPEGTSALKINEMIKAIAEENYRLIQELKRK